MGKSHLGISKGNNKVDESAKEASDDNSRIELQFRYNRFIQI